MKKQIFDFNHIDPKLSEETRIELEEFYNYYHKQMWCYKKALKKGKKASLALNISASFFIVLGTVIGGITANPIILGSITGAGILLKTFSETKKFPQKNMYFEFAFKTYEKTLIDLRSFLRGNHFDHDVFVKDMKLLDSIIADFEPIPTKISLKYNKTFKNGQN